MTLPANEHDAGQAEHVAAGPVQRNWPGGPSQTIIASKSRLTATTGSSGAGAVPRAAAPSARPAGQTRRTGGSWRRHRAAAVAAPARTGRTNATAPPATPGRTSTAGRWTTAAGLSGRGSNCPAAGFRMMFHSGPRCSGAPFSDGPGSAASSEHQRRPDARGGLGVGRSPARRASAASASRSSSAGCRQGQTCPAEPSHRRAVPHRLALALGDDVAMVRVPP